MQRLVTTALAGFLLAGASAQAVAAPLAPTASAWSASSVPVAQQAVPSQDKVQALADYNIRLSEAINGYIGLISDETLYALFMRADPYGEDAFAEVGEAMTSRLAALRVQKRAFDAIVEDLPATPPQIGRAETDAAMRDSRPYALRLGRLTDEVFASWDRQIAALAGGDTAAYDRAVNSELDTSVILLEAENELIRIQQAAQRKDSPLYWHFEAIMAGNQVLLPFIELINGYEESTTRSDQNDYAALTDALAAMDRAVGRAEKATAAFCAGNPGGRAGGPWSDICASFGRTDENERRMLTTLRGYGDVALALVETRFGEADQARLLELERELAALTDRRVALQMERIPLGQALLDALR